MSEDLDFSAAIRFAGELRDGVTFSVDGRAVVGRSGEMLAAALMAAGIWQLRVSPVRRDPRGAFCLMGVCQECIVRVDGRSRQACLTEVAAGLDVETTK